MVNNSTNINKTNNPISPQTIEHKKYHDIMAVEIQVLPWDRHNNLVALNWLMGSHIPSLIIGSGMPIQI